MDTLISKADLLTEEMLPYIQKFHDKIFVIKYGGNAMVSEESKRSVLKDIALLKSVGIKTIVVHGGGPDINREMEKAGLVPKFIEGLRVTDKQTLHIIEDVFSKINQDIRNILSEFGVSSEEVRSAVIARPKNPELGFVGEIINVNTDKINSVLDNGKIPVISTIGISKKSNFNINADTAATKIAIFMKAEKLTILTDVDGVLAEGKLISHLPIDQAEVYISSKIITKGMIPKVEACIEAVQAGCSKAHLINGTIRHSLLFEIFTEKGIGTEIVEN